MNVLQVLGAEDRGGAHDFALDLAKDLRARNHCITTSFIFRKEQSGRPNEHVTLRTAPPYLAGVPLALLRLVTLARKCQPDILVSHTPSASLMSAFLRASLRIRRHIVVVHSPLQPKRFLLEHAARNRVPINVGTHIVAVSPSVRHSIATYCPSALPRTLVIRNGLPPDFDSQSFAKRAEAKVCNPGSPLRIVTVGRLAPEKNQAAIIRSIASTPSIHLTIVGEGPSRQELTALVSSLDLSKRVVFAGHVTRTKLHSLLWESDVFVLPSLFEGLPLALIEAMSLGLPCLASDIPASRDVLGDYSGLFHPTDIEALAVLIRLARIDPAFKQTLVDEAAKRLPLFTRQTMVDAYHALFCRTS